MDENNSSKIVITFSTLQVLIEFNVFVLFHMLVTSVRLKVHKEHKTMIVLLNRSKYYQTTV